MNNQQIQLFSSKKTDNWCTPKKLYNQLNDEFYFDFDPCPLNSTFDGLIIPWGISNYVNPPYSKIKEFLKKAHYELKHNPKVQIIVFLTFVNTDTKWFWNYVYKQSEIRFIKGRLKFEDENGNITNSAMRPSMLAIFKNNLNISNLNI